MKAKHIFVFVLLVSLVLVPVILSHISRANTSDTCHCQKDSNGAYVNCVFDNEAKLETSLKSYANKVGGTWMLYCHITGYNSKTKKYDGWTSFVQVAKSKCVGNHVGGCNNYCVTGGQDTGCFSSTNSEWCASGGCSTPCYAKCTVEEKAGVRKCESIISGPYPNSDCTGTCGGGGGGKTTTTAPGPGPTTVPTTTTVCRTTMHGYVFNVSGGWVPDAQIRCSNEYNDYQATSGRDGYYSIQGMECGKYTCSVFNDKFRSSYYEVFLTAQTKRKDFYLTRNPGNAGDLEGYVFDSAGGPVGDAYIKCDNGYFSHSDPDGYYKIVDMDAGSYTCSATADGFKVSFKSVMINPERTSKANFYLFKKQGTVTTVPGGGGEIQPPIYIGPPVVILPQFGSIAGFVREENTKMPLQEATVNCKGYTTFTDVFGRYRIDGVPEGTYLCYSEKAGYHRQNLKVFVSPGLTSRADFFLPKQNDCTFDVYMKPGESMYEGPENTFHVILYDRSVASCKSPISYSVDYDYKGGCEDVQVNPGHVVVPRGSSREIDVYAAAKQGETCTIDMKILDQEGNMRAFGSYTVYNPGIDSEVNSISLYGPERVETDQDFSIYAEAYDKSGIREVRLFWDGNLIKSCMNNTCSIHKRVYSPGKYKYYAEAIDNKGNSKQSAVKTVSVIDTKPSSGSLRGTVRSSDATPLPGAMVSCSGQVTQADDTGEYYFDSLPAGNVECSATADGYREDDETIYVNPGFDNVYNFILQNRNATSASSTGSSYNSGVVEAKIIQSDIVSEPWYWWVKYLVLIVLLILLIILVIYYLTRKAAVKEEEELLRELEKYK